MARSILKTSATLLAATAVTGGLVLASPGLAQAATYERGHSDSEKSLQNGTGDADGKARATDAGRLFVFAEADGGDAASPLPGGGTSTPTTAEARAKLSKRVPVADGTYRVVIRYQNIVGTEQDRGQDSDALVDRRSAVSFVSQTGGGNRTVQRVQQVPDNRGTARTVLFVKVPDDASGFLRVSGELRATSTADGAQSFATGQARVGNVTFVVKRV